MNENPLVGVDKSVLAQEMNDCAVLFSSVTGCSAMAIHDVVVCETARLFGETMKHSSKEGVARFDELLIQAQTDAGISSVTECARNRALSLGISNPEALIVVERLAKALSTLWVDRAIEAYGDL